MKNREVVKIKKIFWLKEIEKNVKYEMIEERSIKSASRNSGVSVTTISGALRCVDMIGRDKIFSSEGDSEKMIEKQIALNKRLDEERLSKIVHWLQRGEDGQYYIKSAKNISEASLETGVSINSIYCQISRGIRNPLKYYFSSTSPDFSMMLKYQVEIDERISRKREKRTLK